MTQTGSEGVIFPAGKGHSKVICRGCAVQLGGCLFLGRLWISHDDCRLPSDPVRADADPAKYSVRSTCLWNPCDQHTLPACACEVILVTATVGTLSVLSASLLPNRMIAGMKSLLGIPSLPDRFG